MLNITRIKIIYCGAQQEINQKYIQNKVGYLGLHEQIVEVGYENHMIFQEGDDVPLWMTMQERVDTKFSQYDEPQIKDKTKSELLSDLKSDGMDIFVVEGERVGELQDIYRKNAISLTNIIRK